MLATVFTANNIGAGRGEGIRVAEVLSNCKGGQGKERAQLSGGRYGPPPL